MTFINFIMITIRVNIWLMIILYCTLIWFVAAAKEKATTTSSTTKRTLENLDKMPEMDQQYWKMVNEEEIIEAETQELNEGIAKNVIIFIGDGLGPETITAARIYGKSEDKLLSFERFPHVGKLKTYSNNKLVTDSASAATALFCGSKANDRTTGVDAIVEVDDCGTSLTKEAQLQSLFLLAQRRGLATGFVTTARVTHDTPAALYAHSANSTWECQEFIPVDASRCKDIARQLIEDVPGKNIKVIMGGGRQCLQSNVEALPEDPIDQSACYSSDGRDLIRDWIKDKERRRVTHSVAVNTWELHKLPSVEYVLGIFANSHLRYEYNRDKSSYGVPSLTLMTQKAIEVLIRDNSKGFFLMVEGSLIDTAHHEGRARVALEEVISFDNAVDKAVQMIEEYGLSDETLIIVTADHAHSMVMSGYSNRHKSILSIAQASPEDGINFTTLLYGTGGPHNFQFYVDTSNSTFNVALNPMYNKSYHSQGTQVVKCPEQKVVRQEPSKQDTEDYGYYQQAGILTDEVYHSGVDVTAYAKGPMAHLIHNTHELTYIYYLIGYASNVGPIRRTDEDMKLRI